MTTNEYIIGVKQHGWPSFPGKLWQRNYYEHIIRNEDELNRIRQYICDNPLNWETDEENPNRRGRTCVSALIDTDNKGAHIGAPLPKIVGQFMNYPYII